jgi:hypothetical protein
METGKSVLIIELSILDLKICNQFDFYDYSCGIHFLCSGFLNVKL